VTESTYLDENKQFAQGEDGVAKWSAKYDRSGRRVAQAFLDGAGRPARTKGGYTNWSRAYDERGRKVEEAFCGFDGSHRFFRKSVNVNYEHLERVKVVAHFDAHGGRASSDA
jgi:hypothetical protein